MADVDDRRQMEVQMRSGNALGDPVLLRVQDVARQLRVGRTKVYDLIDEGQLRRVKLGRVALVPATDVEALVARLTSAAGLVREGNGPE